MPAETHQHGRAAGSEEVCALLKGLLLVEDDRIEDGLTLDALGVHDEADLWDLWDAVREEFGERSLSPEVAPLLLTPSMTIAQAAEALSQAFEVSNQEGELSTAWTR